MLSGLTPGPHLAMPDTAYVLPRLPEVVEEGHRHASQEIDLVGPRLRRPEEHDAATFRKRARRLAAPACIVPSSSLVRGRLTGAL